MAFLPGTQDESSTVRTQGVSPIENLYFPRMEDSKGPDVLPGSPFDGNEQVPCLGQPKGLSGRQTPLLLHVGSAVWPMAPDDSGEPCPPPS